MNNQEIKQISYNEAIDFILHRHYAGRKPQITKAFGWYENDILVAVCTFGKPASPAVTNNICGYEYAPNVYELNRLVRIEEFKGQLSQFVSKCLKELKKENWIVVSFADTGMSHHGYIYQACNFLYTGATKQKIDKCFIGKHPRHVNKDNENVNRQIRTIKHRYIYFCTNNKNLKKEWLNKLQFSILPYPKGDNKNYQLGTVWEPPIIDKDKNIINNSEYVMKI